MGALITGDMVRFQTPHESDITHLRAYFTPQQTGSGTPSPTNVRPITGWDGIDVWRTGKNIAKVIGYSAKTYNTPQSVKDYTNTYGTTLSTVDYALPDTPVIVTQSQIDKTQANYHYRNGYFCVILDGLEYDTYYNVSFRVSDIVSNPLDVTIDQIRIRDPSQTYFPATRTIGDRIVFTQYFHKQHSSYPERNIVIIYNCGMSFTLSDFMITPADETDLSFQYYEGSSITTDWSSTAGTVYGGYVDLVTGELAATWWGVTKKVSDYDAKTSATDGIIRYSYIVPGLQFIRNANQICSIAEYQYKEYNYAEPHFYTIYYVSNNISYIYLYLPEGFDTSTEFTVVTQLAEPVVYTLSTQTLKTFVGVNNIWCNADHVEVEYNVIETCDVQEARRRILIAAPHVGTASGSTATFNTDLAAKIKSCKFYFSPVQEGSGTPTPDNVRNIRGWAGIDGYHSAKNIAEVIGYSAKSTYGIFTPTFSLTNNYGTTLSTTAADNSVVVTQSQAPKNDDVFNYRNGYMAICISNSLPFFKQYDVSFRITNITNNPLNINIGNIKLLGPSGSSASAPSVIGDRLIYRNVTYYPYSRKPIKYNFEIHFGGISFTFSDFMVTPAGVYSDMDYAVHDGESLWVEFPVSNKNLFNPRCDMFKYSADQCVNSDNSVTIYGADGRSWTDKTARAPIFLKAGTYSFSAVGADVTFEVRLSDDYSSSSQINLTAANPTLTLDTDKYIKFRVIAPSYPVTVNIQIESGSQVTEFEPYNQIFYGGYVDLVSGELTATWYGVTAKLSDCQVRATDSESGFSGYKYIIQDNIMVRTNSMQMCNIATYSQTWIQNASTHFYADYNSSSGTSSIYLILPPNIDTSTEFTVVSQLQEPVIISLSPQTIKALRGDNNIWNKAGDTEVQYWTHI